MSSVEVGDIITVLNKSQRQHGRTVEVVRKSYWYCTVKDVDPGKESGINVHFLEQSKAAKGKRNISISLGGKPNVKR